MRERNLLDDIDEIEQAARQTPSERFVAGLTLSSLAIAMFRGNPDAPVLDRLEDLEEKARLWAAPLQASKRCALPRTSICTRSSAPPCVLLCDES